MALVALFLILGSVIVAADEIPAYEAFPRALGVAVGQISGTGLHYHRWDGPTGWHVSAGVLYLPPTDDPWIGSYTATVLNYTAGAAFQRRVYADSFTSWLTGSLYLFAGGNHRGYIPRVETSPGDPAGDPYVPPEYGIGAYAAELTAGVGIGIEIILFRHISIPAEFGYGGTWTMTEPDLVNAFRVDLYGQTALRYRY